MATPRGPVLALLLSVFVVATCGLVYELLAGTLASYLLGDTVLQFSTVIGTYLFAMGIGSYLSKYVQGNLVARFVTIEVLVGAVGGSSAALLFTLFPHVDAFGVPLYGLVVLTGIFVGVEIPLMMRILQDRFTFSELVAQVFTFDYIGALLASLLFPLVLVPQLGLVRTGFLFGMLNVAVALWTLHLFRKEPGRWVASLRMFSLVVLVGLLVGFVYSDRILAAAENEVYEDEVIYANSSPYQRMVLTNDGGDLRLYLNGNLQFSSRDEYRYHEALVHPGMASLPNPRDILVLGGGDGMAVRELLRYPGISHITLVDLDPSMTRLFGTHPLLSSLNNKALQDKRVEVINADAFAWLKAPPRQYDFILIDFPDPGNYAIGKLYSTVFYHRLQRALASGGAVVVQSTSPWVARRAFWCIDTTLQAAGFRTLPYHAHVPSFGEWGFILASRDSLPQFDAARLPKALRFVTPSTWVAMQEWPADMKRIPAEVNRLNNQVLVQYFTDAWKHE